MDTDTQIFDDMVVELKSSLLLRYTRLNLHVQDGIVTISGRVNSLAERTAVEHGAKRVAGIKTLFFEIHAAAIPTTAMSLPLGAQQLVPENLPGLIPPR